MNKSNAGRPTVMTEEVLAKLKEAFLMGCTVTEACLNADIHRSILYRYIEENPDYRDKIEEWKEHPFLLARGTIIKNMKNPDVAKWYLERKKKAEFAQRQEVTGSEGESFKVIVDFMDGNSQENKPTTEAGDSVQEVA